MSTTVTELPAAKIQTAEVVPKVAVSSVIVRLRLERRGTTVELVSGKPHIVQLLAALRYSPDFRLAQLKGQILVVHGENDLLVPGENSKIIADWLGRAPLLTVPGGGHELPVDSRKFLIHLIRSFIK